jgi:hypothetical protein
MINNTEEYKQEYMKAATLYTLYLCMLLRHGHEEVFHSCRTRRKATVYCSVNISTVYVHCKT